ncbi:MAG: sulfite exporter TauE/SafE family protein [Candidatus Harrisonbacteria bacterium]|nr:sulfite exporter TauE/SafE family protein [Candidatus Harrisonbacteria bacterium]
MDISLIIPAFIAGVLTFLAPCTLPLVPGYLGFISGASLEDLKNPEKAKRARWKIFLNGFFFMAGFSAVFIILGTLVGFIGATFLAPYRLWLVRIGGIFVIIFGFFMLNIVKIPFLMGEKQFKAVGLFKQGKPINSFILGSAFAFGWTPCVGPILGSILLLASTASSALQGALLLTIFSAGLAVPFLLIAVGIGSASRYIKNISKYLNIISIIGGLFLIFLGVLLLTNKLGIWIAYLYRIFNFINYDKLLDYL